MIHELIHAEMYRKLLSLSQQGSILWSEEFIHGIRNHYPDLHDYYMRWRYDHPEGVPSPSPQHQLMAQHYRNVIKQVLFDNSQTDEVYNALSWAGLMGGGENVIIDPITGLVIDALTEENRSTVAWTNLDANERWGVLFTYRMILI